MKIYKNINLGSINGLADDSIGRQFIVNFLLQLCCESKTLVVFSVRRNYDIENLFRVIKSEEDEMIPYTLEINTKDNKIFYILNTDLVSYHHLNILVDIWFAFEQVVFTFYLSKITPDNMIVFSKNRNAYWEDILTRNEGFVMFKGIEEDVIWLGKSKELEFPTVE